LITIIDCFHFRVSLSFGQIAKFRPITADDTPLPLIRHYAIIDTPLITPPLLILMPLRWWHYISLILDISLLSQPPHCRFRFRHYYIAITPLIISPLLINIDFVDIFIDTYFRHYAFASWCYASWLPLGITIDYWLLLIITPYYYYIITLLPLLIFSPLGYAIELH
jgi:hypothetical protein